jgi:adenylate kinase
MRIAVTGTPGTGKTTATERLETDLSVIHLNDLITEEALTTGHDDDRDSAIADLDAVRAELDGREDIVVESHLAHTVPVDRVIVLRCRPDELEQRLADRGESEASISENAESEALDVILGAAVDQHGLDSVYEIETTERSPDAVAAEIESVIEGTREPSAGTVSYTEYL